MLDDLQVFVRLESNLHAALSQALQVTIAAADADAAAIRVFGVPDEIPAAQVLAERLGPAPADRAALDCWPMAEGSLFHLLDQHADPGIRDDAFRPHQRLGLASNNHQALCGPIVRLGPLQDVYCLSFPLTSEVWSAAVYCRCGQRPPFEDRHLATLDRFKPALRRVVRRGLADELKGRGIALPELGEANHVPSLAILTRLSRTERQILDHLRQQQTERQIAEATGRSPHTVHVHVKNIYRKLNISSRRQLLEMFEGQAV